MYFNSWQNRKKYLLFGLISLLVIALTCGISIFVSEISKKKEEKQEKEFIENHPDMAEKSHDLYLVIVEKCSYNYDMDYPIDTQGGKIKITVPSDGKVHFTITPPEGKEVRKLEITDSRKQAIAAKKLGHSYEFQMPDSDVTVTPFFKGAENKNITVLPIPSEDQKSKYEIEVQGLTEEIKKSCEGKFSEVKFVNALGDALGVRKSNSIYNDVVTVTFCKEKDQAEEGEVGYYLILNNNIQRRILAVFDLKQEVWLFDTNIQEPEPTVQPTPTVQATPTAQSAPTVQPTPTIQPAPAEKPKPTLQQQQPVRQPTPEQRQTQKEAPLSFSLERISSEFISYVGNKEKFFDEIFNELRNRGYTGNLVGTFESFKLDQGSAAFTISLNNGTTIQGIYHKDTDTYTF